MNIAVVRKTQVTRPLKVLVPLIKNELLAANDAGLEHYRHAGEMLNEAKTQLSGGSWTSWLTKNFELSKRTANRYMRLATKISEDYQEDTERASRGASMYSIIGEKHSRHEFKPVFAAADKINVSRLADERKTLADEVKLHRELALKLIDLGYRALATRLHPDRGGSRDAMARLNVVRDELKSIAEIRRFV